MPWRIVFGDVATASDARRGLDASYVRGARQGANAIVAHKAAAGVHQGNPVRIGVGHPVVFDGDAVEAAGPVVEAVEALHTAVGHAVVDADLRGRRLAGDAPHLHAVRVMGVGAQVAGTTDPADVDIVRRGCVDPIDGHADKGDVGHGGPCGVADSHADPRTVDTRVGQRHVGVM